MTDKESGLERRFAQLTEKISQTEVAVYFTGSNNATWNPATATSTLWRVCRLYLCSRSNAKYSNRIVVDLGFSPYGLNRSGGAGLLAMALAGYDAVAVGDQDLYIVFLWRRQRAGRFPVQIKSQRRNAGAADKTQWPAI